MSLPPLPPPPGGPAQPAAAAGAGGGATSGGAGLGLKIGGGVVGLALVGGAAFGAYTLWENTLGGGGPQPADVLPASTVGYVRLDLDPSASQKVDLLNLIDRVPQVKDGLGLQDVDSQDDLREAAFTEWFGLEDLCDVDYDTDVKPWLGERAALAVVGDFEITDDEQETAESVAANSVIVIQVTDEEKARDGIVKLAEDCGIMDSIANDLDVDAGDPGIVFRDGYALVTIDQDAADAIDAAADKGTLAGDNEAFSDDMDALGEDGIVSGWYDQKTLFAKIEDSAPEELEDISGIYEKLETTAFTLRATDETLEIAGTAQVDHEFDLPDTESLAGLPADTLLGLSLVGGETLSGRLWDAIVPMAELYFDFQSAFYTCPDYDDYDYVEPSPAPTDPEVPPDPEVQPPTPTCEEPPTFDEQLEAFEAETGLSLPEDLEALFGQEFNIYVGGEDVDDAANAHDLEDALDAIDAGVEVVSDDKGETADVFEALIEYFHVGLDVTTTDEGVVIATNDDAADKLENDDDLGTTETFGSVIDEHDQLLGGGYLDIAGVVDALKAFGAPNEFTDELAFLRALGITAWAEDDGVVSFSAKLSFTPEEN